jgi:hypothetical protein
MLAICIRGVDGEALVLHLSRAAATNWWEDLREGARYVFSHPILRYGCMLFTLTWSAANTAAIIDSMPVRTPTQIRDFPRSAKLAKEDVPTSVVRTTTGHAVFQ